MTCCCKVRLRVAEPDVLKLSVSEGDRIDIASDQYVRMVVVDQPEYEGPYVVVPMVAAQTLPTENKAARDDIEVLGIPYAEVSNPSGGKTATIG